MVTSRPCESYFVRVEQDPVWEHRCKVEIFEADLDTEAPGDLVASGDVKFDGCGHVSFQCPIHLCGPETLEEFHVALRQAYALVGTIQGPRHPGLVAWPAVLPEYECPSPPT